MSTLFGGRPCVNPTDVYAACVRQELPTDWWGQANLFKVPLGRGPGTGRILLKQRDLQALDLKTEHTLRFLDDRGVAVEIKRVTLLAARCVMPGWRDDPDSPYLCDLVDRRHFLAQIPVDKAYNVRDAAGTAYLSATLNSGVAWTWAGAVQDLWTVLGLGSAPALPFTPDGTPENLVYWQGMAWDALTSLLRRLACEVCYDPTTDAFTFVRLGDTAAVNAISAANVASALDRTRTWDAAWNEPDRGRLVEKVRVVFQRRPMPSDGSSPYYAVDVTLPATAGVQAGTYVVVHDDLSAVGSGTPTNAAACAARAAERAADWRRKRVGYERRLCKVWRDFERDAPKLLSSLAAGIALDDRGAHMRTELVAEPDGELERWRAYEQPFVQGVGTGSGSYTTVTLATNVCPVFGTVVVTGSGS